MVNLRLILVENVFTTRREHFEGKPGERDELLVREDARSILLHRDLTNGLDWKRRPRPASLVGDLGEGIDHGLRVLVAELRQQKVSVHVCSWAKSAPQSVLSLAIFGHFVSML